VGEELSFGSRSAAMRNPEREVHYFRVRILVATTLVLLAFAALVARFAWLQVVKHDAYLAQAEQNRIALLPVSPNRGLIKDRNGKIIARNYSATRSRSRRRRSPTSNRRSTNSRRSSTSSRATGAASAS
jgi:cell division protein FtsI/penicillin-binding protein 2